MAAEILAVLSEEEMERREPRITRLQARVYLNWHVLQRYLDDLALRELIERDGLRLTEKGRTFLDFCRDVRSTLGRFGF